MNWIDSIREIQRAAENNRLVIFVGAGVSANSKIPTWGDLIKRFAEEIGYDNCTKCDKRTAKCPKADCNYRYKFSQDEYLRIPEYYFLRDKSKKKRGYYDLIRRTLGCDKGANSIHDAVFKIMPHHIITTNFDSLLENSKEINARLYSIISQDKDILLENNTYYIIKMHGDLQNPESIVLKESDYINYEQTHPLICTFIKSLLIDHTFLFIGYSLNDYNLKLIIGWINYFCEIYGIKNRPHSFIVHTDETLELEKDRLKCSNIFVISIRDMPQDILEKITIPSDLEDQRGKMLYAYLNCIYDPNTYYHYIPLEDVLYEKYMVLNTYRKISYEDLIKTFPFGRTDFMGRTLCFEDKVWYQRIHKILSGESEKDKFIYKIFQKAGIYEIYCPENEERMQLEIIEDENNELFKLYLDNKYMELLAKLNDSDNVFAQVYYYNFLQQSVDKINKLMNDIEQTTLDGDYIRMLIYKMNLRLLKRRNLINVGADTKEIERILNTVPPKYKNAIGYLEKVFRSMAENYSYMEELLRKQEDKYSYDNRTIYFEHSFDKIWRLQAYAYDYYFFIKENFLMMDYFIEPRTFFSYYIKAILCSYSPVIQSSANTFLGIENDLEPYPLGEIEIDMIVKYTKSKDLLAWIKQYKVHNLIIDEGINVTAKYVSYCNCYPESKNIIWADQLFCFVILLSKITFCESEINEMSEAFVELMVSLSKNNAQDICRIFGAITLFIVKVVTKEQKGFMEKILFVLSEPNVTTAIVRIHDRHLDRILAFLAPYASTDVKQKICDEIAAIDNDRIKCAKIFTFRKIIPMQEYEQYLKDHFESISAEHLFYFVIEDYIPYNESVLERYIEIIAKEAELRESQPHSRSYPDKLVLNINRCIILKLMGKPVDLSKLAPYRRYSNHLEFLLSPENFDYSKIDTSDYMWQNFFTHNEYIPFFKSHKQEILNDELGKVFSNGFASINQQRIVYGLLLDNDQIWDFPNPKM